MQKKIIALAIAGLASSAAFAQTNVQIYGVADMAITYDNVNGGVAGNALGQAHGRDRLNVQSGQLAGSRLGFRGTEDLGNGLKAVFVLEYGLDLANDAGIGANPIGATSQSLRAGGAFARQQYVGLNGGFGTISLGRQYAPGWYASSNDALVWSPNLSPKAITQTFLNGTITGGSNARWDNSVNYVTNNMGGVTLQAIYQGGAQQNELSSRESYGLGVKYEGGPVVVEYVYQNAKTLTTTSNLVFGGVAAGAGTATTGLVAAPTVTSADGARLEEHYIGGSFDAKVVKVFASWQTMDQGDKAVAGLGNKGNAGTIGVQVPVGKGTIHAAYAYADKNTNTRAGGTYRGEQNVMSVAYTHALSKRTTLYTGVAYTDQDVVNAGQIQTTVAAGINHKF